MKYIIYRCFFCRWENGRGDGTNEENVNLLLEKILTPDILCGTMYIEEARYEH